MTKTIAKFAWLSTALAFAAGTALAAQGPFANVSADAVCTFNGSDLLINAVLVQKLNEGVAAYTVSGVKYSVEQKVPGSSKFTPVPNLVATDTFVPALSITAVAAGASAPVDDHFFPSVCTSGVVSQANSVRGVVEITVTNAKDPIVLGRCISLPNPCR